MPGTHAKWVRIEDGHVTAFATAMTGELFDVLRHHSVLRHSLGQELVGPETEKGIAEGLTHGLETPERLTSLLFRTRAASLLSNRPPDWCAGYLSGLLVGAEVAGYRSWLSAEPIPLIGSERLCRLYARALSMAGAQTETINADAATLAGLSAARAQIAHD